jgi:HEAT repeat protein/chemotaxis signal transduction protein
MVSDNPDIQLACFSLGENLFGVDIMRIREIILPQKISALPGAPQMLEGVISLRGAVIPVMNMRRRFAMPESADSSTGKLLIISLARMTLALAVDSVMEVITVPVREIKPPLDTADGIGMEYLLGVCLSGDRVFIILDIDSLLNAGTPYELSQIDATGTTDHKRVAVQGNTQVNTMQEIQTIFQSADEETRRRVIQDLRGRPLQEICRLLFSAMGDESWRIRKEAVEVFISSDPGESMIDNLLELLRNEDNAGLRNSAAEAVTRLGERATAPLIRLVHDADADVRKFVIDTMGSINSVDFVQPLLAALRDNDVNVAAAAAEHLGNLEDARVVPELIKAIVSNESELFRFNALAAIGKLAVPAPVPDEIKQLVGNDLLRKAVYECLGSIADDSAVVLLMEGLEVRQKSCRNAAVKALFRIYFRSGEESRQAIESALQCLKGGYSVPVLLESFDPRDPILAEALVVIFDIIGDKRCVEIFLQAFVNERLSGVALKAFKHLGPDGIDTLISGFADSDTVSRSAICTLIGECDYRTGRVVICDALCDQSPLVRNAAVTAAGKLGLTDCIPVIVRLLDDPDHDVRSSVVACLQSLARSDCSGIQAVARQLGASVQPEQRRNAAILFAALGDGDRLSLLVKDEDALVRQAAVASIGKLNLAPASDILLMALADEDPDVRIASAEALGEVGDRGAVTALTHALNDEDAWVQCAALNSLARINPEGTLNAVQSVLPGAEGLLLITCLKLLESLGSDRALELVEQALDTSDEEVVTLALSIIGRRAVDRIVPYAVPLLAHGNWDVRIACARTVALLPALQAGKLLTQALGNETNDLVRTEMQSLLKGLA